MADTRETNSGASPPDALATLRAALRGRYEIEREIGQGAFATVYLARDLKHERKVAIKVLNADPSSETGEIRFIREIRLVARLQHPNILPLHDSGHVENQLYYVMPYVMGETLRIRMHRERQMGIVAASSIARETADALAYAHAQGIVHRDIKPENILLSGGHAVVADFGIARAIDVSGVKQLTMTGMGGPGTPAYMSPEQLLGDRGVDSRSDIYSLGCVLYEMLAGKPPFPGKDGFVKRFTEPPPHITSLRRDAPPWVDEVLSIALAKDPADRYQTASDFVTALSQATSGVRTPSRQTPLRNPLASPPMFETDPLDEQEFARSVSPHNLRTPARAFVTERVGVSPVERAVSFIRANRVAAVLGMLVLVIVLVATVASKTRSVGGASGTPDAARADLLAIVGPGGSAGRPASGSGVADSLYDALAKWDAAPVVSDATIAEAASDVDFDGTANGAVSLARRLGAGKAVWVQTSGSATNPRHRIHVYDAGSGRSVDDFAVPTGARDNAFYSAAAVRLLGFGNRPPSAEGCDDRTRSYRAWRWCNAGHVTLAAWDLVAAERAFREAVAADGGYAPARVWLAQVVAWRVPEKRTEAHDLVRGARESGLGKRDSLAAIGLAALLEQRFPNACTAYRQLTQVDSLDYLGWYGLGECQALDSVVVRNAASPSRWAFRSSWHSAVSNYMTAIRVEPGTHAIPGASKLQSLLPVASTFARQGIGGPDRQRFGAYPTLESGDTVGYVPYPVHEFALLERTPAADAALRRNTVLLYEYAVGAADRFPLSARAQEALAHALEARAELGEGSVRASAAIRSIDSAITLVMRSGDDNVRLRDVVRLRAQKIRVHFKRGEFSTARLLADSLIATRGISSDWADLLGIAALTGRAELAAQQYQPSLRARALRGGTVPPQVATPASRYFVYAALGICGTPLNSARDALDASLRDYITDDIRETLRADLITRPALLSAPCTNGQSTLPLTAGGDRLTMAQQAFARGDKQRARAMLIAAANRQSRRRPGDLSAEYVFQQAWLRTQVGDTAAAVAAIDGALGALPTFSAATFKDPGGAAAFGRLMALRGEIAARQGDMRTANKWSAALNELWASADPPLRRRAAEVSSLARSGIR